MQLYLSFYTVAFRSGLLWFSHQSPRSDRTSFPISGIPADGRSSAQAGTTSFSSAEN